MKLLSLVLLLFFVQINTSFAALKVKRYVNYNGGKVAVYESKGKHGPAVLLVHGNTSSANSFEKIMTSPWAMYHKVIAMDLPGYGKSDNYASYSIGHQAGAIVKVAQVTGANKGILVGWSLGGDLALQASTSLPQLKGVFVFGTAPVGVDPTLPSAFLAPSESYAGITVTYGTNPNLTNAQVNDYITAFFRPNYTNFSSSFLTDGLRADPATRQAVLDAVIGNDPTFQDEVAIVRNSTIPVAIVLGEQEAFVRMAFLDALAPSIPNLYKNKIIKVKNAGHAIQWEYPTKFIAILQSFIWEVAH
ncbi:alpha/beta fold hydrolase [Bdellovibrio sp. HCB209]|uniref:alpha/beta fold hydrolase n=1 Tax=Bdellovibrio sp. HCB209 TaxID=3394354 RepID=UPI0039B6808A